MYGPIKYMDALDGSVSIVGGPIWLAPDNINNWSMQVVTTGTLTGTFTFEASNDPRARQTASSTDQTAAQWTDVTSALVGTITNPSGSTTNQVIINKTSVPWSGAFLRMKYTKSSGAGTVTAYFNGMSS